LPNPAQTFFWARELVSLVIFAFSNNKVQPMNQSQVDKSALIDKLHALVTEKIAAEWDTHWNTAGEWRYGRTFRGFTSMPNRNGFYADLKDEIDNAIKQRFDYQKANELGVSSDSIQRLLENKQAGTKTLNAVTIYLGFEHWEVLIEYLVAETVVPQKKKQVGEILRKNGVTIAMSCLLMAVGWAFWHFWPSPPKQYPRINPLKIIGATHGQFAPTKITFSYDLRAYDYDSAFLNYDGRKVPLTKPQDTLSHTYIYPDMHNIHLRLDTVKYVLALPIKTDRWLGAINWEGGYAEDMYRQQGVLHIPKKSLPVSMLSLPEYYTSYRSIQDFEAEGDSVAFEIRAKNSKAEGGSGCFDIGLNLGGSHLEGSSFVRFNVMHEGCDQYIHVQAGRTHVGWQAATPRVPLSSLGVYSDDWVVIKAITKNQILHIYVNGTLRYSLPYQGKIGKVKLLQIDFKGSGKLDYVKLSHSHTGKRLYFDDFN
jgi:hypothetical protein